MKPKLPLQKPTVGGTAGGLADRPTEPITKNDSQKSAAAKLCHGLLIVLRNDAPGAIKGENPEHVHRMRVAIRKLRIVLQLWNTRIDKKKSERLREDIRWLTGLLGRARDADILAARFETQWNDGIFSEQFKEYVRQRLRQRGAAERAQLTAALVSGRFERLQTSLEHLFDPKALTGEDGPLRKMVPQFFRFAVKKAGRYAGRKLDDDELHSLRIAFKRLRYLAEFFGPLYPGKLAGCLRKFKKYQELLGIYCDAQVGEAFLTSLITGETSDTPASRRRCREIGGFIYIQRRDAADQQRRFDKKRTMLPKLLKAIRQQTKRI